MMREKPRETVKFCYACGREDVHVRFHLGCRFALFVKVLTLGLAIPLWPCRCVTCGRQRVHNDWIAAVLVTFISV